MRLPDPLTLAEWLSAIQKPKLERPNDFAGYEFPTDQARDEFLQTISEYDESLIKAVLRSLLISGGGLGADELMRRDMYRRPTSELVDMKAKFEFIRRLLEPPFQPWDGLIWILDLLPNNPTQALHVIDAYFNAHCQVLPDGRTHGLSDAEAIIRCRYLQRSNPREALLALSPEEFEYLVGALFEKMGYQVHVTQRSRDGGVDVEIRNSQAGVRTLALVQCKRYESSITVKTVRELMGVVASKQANKGIVVATCRYTATAIREANVNEMIELIDYAALNLLLNEHLGANWPDRMSYEIRNLQMKMNRKPLN